MTDDKPTRREILRPLHLLGIALACGLFAGFVTLISTGAFTERVIDALQKGTYSGLGPWTLALIVAGSAFIVTLLGLAMLMLAVDPAQMVKPVDRPVLYDAKGDVTATAEGAEGATSPAAGEASGTSDAPEAEGTASGPAR
ncbi:MULTISPECIES: hypothetical protein [Bacteria]|uniref:hypothetical protein n=1 Tax=Bacteria TaxID=2 RepID=UPI003C7ED71B